MLQSLVEDVESTWRSQHGTIACAVPAVLILFVLGDPVAAALRGMRATGLQNEFMILTALALAYSVGMTTAGERARSASKARAVAPSKVLPERCQAKRPVQSMARLSSQVPRASAPVLKTHSDAGRSVQQTSGARSLSHSARLDPEGADTDVLERAKSEGVAPNAQAWSLVVGACVRLENSGVALELLEQMLAQGAHHEAELRNSSTVGKFFRLVVEHLDEQRMREIGVQLLDVIQAHGLAPTAIVQNRLICAWKSKPPDEVLRALVGLRDRGVRLTPTAYRCIMFANERARPEFTLQLYEDLDGRARGQVRQGVVQRRAVRLRRPGPDGQGPGALRQDARARTERGDGEARHAPLGNVPVGQQGQVLFVSPFAHGTVPRPSAHRQRESS
ncbi:unnamed protein product [Prorocentrum cordatum]|uniref:Pentatricopeptide repeat-containing protein n=1 Tax=Prorocentrum cordatum TaxID=2364126 RepID=A0ABN9XK64_9DINO|nr:unnamed protein product [Polarella glacialis]